MADIESLEKYFDTLLSQEDESSLDHPLAEDSARFERFDGVRRDFSTVSGYMGKMSPLVQLGYNQYLSTVNQLQLSFHSLSSIDNEELDHYLRTMAVEKMVYRTQNAGKKTSEMLGYMAEGLMMLFFDEGEELSKLAQETMSGLQHLESGVLSEEQEQQLQQIIIQALGTYENIEEALSAAKQGIMSKDKKMMKILRSVKIGMGKGLVQTAIAKTQRDKEESPMGAGHGESITSQASNIMPGGVFTGMSSMGRGL